MEMIRITPMEKKSWSVRIQRAGRTRFTQIGHVARGTFRLTRETYGRETLDVLALLKRMRVPCTHIEFGVQVRPA